MHTQYLLQKDLLVLDVLDVLDVHQRPRADDMCRPTQQWTHTVHHWYSLSDITDFMSFMTVSSTPLRYCELTELHKFVGVSEANQAILASGFWNRQTCVELFALC
jgi:hypothetical protein